MMKLTNNNKKDYIYSVSLMHAFKMVQLRSVNKSDLRWDTLSDVLLL